MTIPITATKQELEDANAFADEFLKEPIAVDTESIEVCGFLLWQSDSDPVTSGPTIARPEPALVAGKFRWVVEAPCIRPATYWEPEEADIKEIGRADSLMDAMSMVAHAMLDQEIRNFNECRFYERMRQEQYANQ